MIEAKREEDVVTLTMSVKEAQFLGFFLGEVYFLTIKNLVDEASDGIRGDGDTEVLCHEINHVVFSTFDKLDDSVDTSYNAVLENAKEGK